MEWLVKTTFVFKYKNFIHVPFKYESIDKFLTVATSPTLIVTGSSSYWKSVHVEGLNPGGSYSEGVTA